MTITVEDAVYHEIDWLTQSAYYCMPDVVCYLEVMTNESKADSILDDNEDA